MNVLDKFTVVGHRRYKIHAGMVHGYIYPHSTLMTGALRGIVVRLDRNTEERGPPYVPYMNQWRISITMYDAVIIAISYMPLVREYSLA